MTSADLDARLRLARDWLLARAQERTTWAGIATITCTVRPNLSGAAEGLIVLGLLTAGVALILYTGEAPPPSPPHEGDTP